MFFSTLPVFCFMIMSFKMIDFANLRMIFMKTTNKAPFSSINRRLFKFWELVRWNLKKYYEKIKKNYSGSLFQCIQQRTSRCPQRDRALFLISIFLTRFLKTFNQKYSDLTLKKSYWSIFSSSTLVPKYEKYECFCLFTIFLLKYQDRNFKWIFQWW